MTSYIRRGQGAPLVLVHGVGLHADIWVPQLDALRERFDIIAMDMLGHGGSSLPPPDATLDDFANQVYALLNVLELERAHFAGHSMGGMVALDFAVGYSSRAICLAVLNPVFKRNPEQRDAVVKRAAMLREDAPAEIAEATIARWFGDPAPERFVHHAQTVRDMLGSVDPAGYARAYRIFANIDDVDERRLRELKVPCAFMTGRLDPHSTPDMCAGLANLTPNGRSEILPGERHMMMLTAPGEVNARLLDFLCLGGASGSVHKPEKEHRP